MPPKGFRYSTSPVGSSVDDNGFARFPGDDQFKRMLDKVAKARFAKYKEKLDKLWVGSSPMVSVTVGRGKEKLVVHMVYKDMLVAASPVFAATNSFIFAEKKYDQEYWESILFWTSTYELKYIQIYSGDPDFRELVHKAWDNLIRTYIQAELLEMRVLMNTCLDHMMRLYLDVKLLPLDHFKWMYDHTTEESGMRRLISDLIYYNIEDRSEFRQYDEWDRDILLYFLAKPLTTSEYAPYSSGLDRYYEPEPEP